MKLGLGIKRSLNTMGVFHTFRVVVAQYTEASLPPLLDRVEDSEPPAVSAENSETLFVFNRCTTWRAFTNVGLQLSLRI